MLELISSIPTKLGFAAALLGVACFLVMIIKKPRPLLMTILMIGFVVGAVGMLSTMSTLLKL